jgi:hypothetical protein
VLYVFFSWPALLAERLSPWGALRRSILLVRAHFTQVAALAGLMLAIVLVFGMLTGIFIGEIMALAGPQAQSSHAWSSLSRWLMGGVVALPIVYVSAVSITAFRLAAASQDAGAIR